MTALTSRVTAGLVALCIAGGSLLTTLQLQRSEVMSPVERADVPREESAREVPTARVRAEGFEPAGRSAETTAPAGRTGVEEPSHAEVVVVPGARMDTTLRVAPGGCIEGIVRVTGESGARMSVRAQPLGPLEGAQTQAPGSDTPRRSMKAQQTSTDSEGGFLFAGLPAGHYQISVADEGIVHRALWRGRVRVDIGVRRRCDVTLCLQDVSVEVTDAARTPLEGVELLLVGRKEIHAVEGGTGLRRRAVTDAQGRASFLRITSGHYSISGRCDAPALTVAPREVMVDLQPLALRLVAAPRRP